MACVLRDGRLALATREPIPNGGKTARTVNEWVTEVHCHTVGFSTRRVRRRHYESLKNQVFQNERERTLLSCAAGGRRTGTADLPSLRGVGADTDTDASRDARLRPDAAERTERTECADGGRGGTLLLASPAAGAPSRGGGRGAAPLCAVWSGMREGRRRGVPPGPLAWRSSSSASSGMGSGSMSRMLLCGSRLRSRLSPERARSRVSSCRTRARAPSNSMFFSSNWSKCQGCFIVEKTACVEYEEILRIRQLLTLNLRSSFWSRVCSYRSSSAVRSAAARFNRSHSNWNLKINTN